MADEPGETDGKEKTSRDKELSKIAAIREKLEDLYSSVQKGFDDQRKRADQNADHWDAFHSILSNNQFYSGNSQIFVPIINDAVNARKTRFVNQLFPQNGRYVDVTTGDVEQPSAIMAVLEHYVRVAKLRTEMAPALSIQGDVEGQYTVYTGWRTHKRHTVTREQEPVVVDGLEVDPDIEGGEPVETLREETIDLSYPYVEIIPDADFLVLPATSDSIEDALNNGGSVTVLRRWSKSAIKQMIKDGEITRSSGEGLLSDMGSKMAQPNTRQNPKKEQAKAAGIKAGGSHVLGYETWSRIKVDGEMRLCVSRFGGEKQVLGCKLCPYWSDMVPIISAPAEKVAGSFKGKAPVANVLDMQIFANDTLNEGADTSHFSAMPPILTDPLKNPRIETMVYGLGAVWSTNPNDTKILQFPELWRTALERTAAIKEQIFQSLGVNPAMVPQGTGGRKRNQAEIATEQQVDILTTADAVTIMEEGVFSPLLTRWAWYDHQFREEDITVRKFGEMGVKANMERIEPIQMGSRYDFRWYGVEATRNAARLQQQNAVLATIMKIPPQLFGEYELDVTPMIVATVEDTFGPRLGPLLFKKKEQVAVDPELENGLLLHGFDVKVHFGDDDIKHIQSHVQLLQDPLAADKTREHIMRHQKQLQAKADLQMKQTQGAPGPGGAPGGAPAGAQPQGPQQPQGPAGAIHPDRLAAAGAVTMPRKT